MKSENSFSVGCDAMFYFWCVTIRSRFFFCHIFSSVKYFREFMSTAFVRVFLFCFVDGGKKVNSKPKRTETVLLWV